MNKLVAIPLIMVLSILACVSSPLTVKTVPTVNIETAIAGTQTAVKAQSTSTSAPTNTPAYREDDYLNDAHTLLGEFAYAFKEYSDFISTTLVDDHNNADWIVKFINSVTAIDNAGKKLGRLTPPTERVEILDQLLKTLSDEISIMVVNLNGCYIDHNQNDCDLSTENVKNVADIFGLAMGEYNRLSSP
jgi:hypothetical protein